VTPDIPAHPLVHPHFTHNGTDSNDRNHDRQWTIRFMFILDRAFS